MLHEVQSVKLDRIPNLQHRKCGRTHVQCCLTLKMDNHPEVISWARRSIPSVVASRVCSTSIARPHLCPLDACESDVRISYLVGPVRSGSINEVDPAAGLSSWMFGAPSASKRHFMQRRVLRAPSSHARIVSASKLSAPWLTHSPNVRRVTKRAYPACSARGATCDWTTRQRRRNRTKERTRAARFKWGEIHPPEGETWGERLGSYLATHCHHLLFQSEK